MRLQVLTSGHGLKHKLMIKASPLLLGAPAPDVMKVLWYRHGFFGVPMGKLEQQVLRGDSEWSVGEREAFAAWVSIKNACRFCADAHSAIANRALGREVAQSLDGAFREDALDERARAILPFLEKLTLSPESLGEADLVPLRAAGISDEAILDAAYVCLIFSTFNRMVEAFGCARLTPAQVRLATKLLLEKGYEV
jgi:uncharacterized peroxidase-related enzyme